VFHNEIGKSAADYEIDGRELTWAGFRRIMVALSLVEHPATPGCVGSIQHPFSTVSDSLIIRSGNLLRPEAIPRLKMYNETSTSAHGWFSKMSLSQCRRNEERMGDHSAVVITVSVYFAHRAGARRHEFLH